jgi:RecJ-like exonuclease
LFIIICIYETKKILLSINSKTTHMEHLLFTCSTCHGRGTVDISRSPEPWVSNYADCQDCEGKGYRYCDEEIDERIDGVDSLIDGMMVRLADLSKWAMECKRGGLENLATRYTNRMDTCARALARLKAYRTKLIKL